MPMQFACTGLIGLIVARMSHAVFRIPRLWAVAIGCLLVSGPFFRYIEGNFFLSTLMSLPVLLHLLWIAAAARPGRRLLEPSAVVRLGAHYVLLLFMYPSFLFAGLALQAVVLGLVALASIQSESAGRAAWVTHLEQAGRSAAAAAVACGVLIAIVPDHFEWSLRSARYLTRPGVAGWAMDLISPLAVFGGPGTSAASRSAIRRAWGIGAYFSPSADRPVFLAASPGDERCGTDLRRVRRGSHPGVLRLLPGARPDLPAVEVRVVLHAADDLRGVCRRPPPA
jgi:hypothetical protein